MPTAPLLTAEELLEMSIEDKQVELVRGRLFVNEPPGPLHGGTAMNIAFEMELHVRTHGGGRVIGAEVGFTIHRSPDTVRAPDVAYLRPGRAPDPLPEKYFEFAPDIAVEVISPRDRPGKVRAKVADWLSAGTALVWVIYPRKRIARVYRADGSETLIEADGSLNGEDVFRGFICPLAKIL